MQIAIDVKDVAIADKILSYLKSFKQDISVDTVDDMPTNTYLNSKQFLKDKVSLENTLQNITSKKTTLNEVDDTFWDDMDKVIAGA